ncbi:hypothetical protein PENSPDRAFT_661168 [Peniophora sp. CONT]|nr:hypothetical protein PENSPDRAFT_661168 [Peniophora sp. CONT]
MSEIRPPVSMSNSSDASVRLVDAPSNCSPSALIPAHGQHLPSRAEVVTGGENPPPQQHIQATSLPDSVRTTEKGVHTSIMLPIGELLVSAFLLRILDKCHSVQALIWFLSDFARSTVTLDTLLIYRQHVDVECHARILRFIVRNNDSVLWQLKVLGWNTKWGWGAPRGHLYAYLVTPLVRCHPCVSSKRYAYFDLDSPLSNFAFEAAQLVYEHMERDDSANLPNDPVTRAIHETFLASPDSMEFHRGMGTGQAMPITDMTESMYANLDQPPSDFNPRGDMYSHRTFNEKPTATSFTSRFMRPSLKRSRSPHLVIARAPDH